jgi:phospholipase C
MPSPIDNIKHMVVLMMENRAFDHMLGFAQSETWPIDGIGEAIPNTDSAGNVVRVSDDAVYSGDFPGTLDPGHATFDVLTQLYGDPDTPVTATPTMEGFVRSYEGKTHDPQKAHRIMKCFSPQKLPVLTQLARQFAVCDRWFSSLPGPTFPNRAFAHGATSIGRVDMGPIWDGMPKTIYELFTDHGLDSRIYYHDSTMAMTFKGLKNQSRYFGDMDLGGGFWSDCKNNKLPEYSFLEPRYANSQDDDDGSYFSASDQHPDYSVEEGEILIQQVFNAIWKNTAVRNSTLLVIVYDEHGGLYDHVPPPPTVNPDGKVWKNDGVSTDPSFDFTRLGVRVPAVLVSPYIEQGAIDHTEYDHTSLIATARKLFLPNWQETYLTRRDRIANTFEQNLTRTEPRAEQIDILPRSLSAPISDHIRAHVNMAAQLERELVPRPVQTGTDPDTITTEKAASDYLLKIKQNLAAVARPPAADGGTGA